MSNSQTFEGFETFYNAFQMSLKMFKLIFLWTIVIYIIGGFIASVFYLGLFATKSIFTFYTAKILVSFSLLTKKAIYINWTNFDGTVAKTTVAYIANNKEIADFVYLNLSKVLAVYKYALVIFVIIPFILTFFKVKAEKQVTKEYIKGSKFLSKEDFLSKIDKNNDETFLPFGALVKTSIFGEIEPNKENNEPFQVKMPTKCETKHTAVIGRPGGGKTVFFAGLISALKSKSDYKGLTYCYKGDYVGKLFNPETDLLFNPLDVRSLNWPLFNEIETRMDIEMVAGSLFPVSASANDKDRFFMNGAKNVFIGILYYLYNNDLTSNKDIWEHVSKTDEEIVKILKMTPGGERGLKNIGNPKYGQASGIFAIFEQQTSCFEYMQYMEGDFSIKDWLENGTGVIYLSNYENLKETLKPILSLFIDLLGRHLLSMNDSDERSIYFHLDELHTLQKLGAIVEILTLTRSKGGKVVFATQSYSQLDEIYGEKLRHSMINSCGNNVIMSLIGDKERKIASDLISDIQFKEYQKTSSMGVSDFKDGISIASQTKKEPLVIPSEIKHLPELSCFVEFANYDGIMRTKLEYKHYNDINVVFEMRPDMKLEKQKNIPLPPKKKKKKKGEAGQEITRNETLEEEIQNIDYDEIASRITDQEIYVSEEIGDNHQNINYDEIAAMGHATDQQ